MGTQNNLFYRSFYAMGTRFEVVIPGPESKRLEKLSNGTCEYTNKTHPNNSYNNRQNYLNH